MEDKNFNNMDNDVIKCASNEPKIIIDGDNVKVPYEIRINNLFYKESKKIRKQLKYMLGLFIATTAIMFSTLVVVILIFMYK